MKTFVEKFIAVESRTELDLDYPNYEGEERNEVMIPHNKLDFAEAPKDVTLTCKHCGIHKVIKAHWKNSVIYSTCNACSREFRYELNNWKQVFKN